MALAVLIINSVFAAMYKLVAVIFIHNFKLCGTFIIYIEKLLHISDLPTAEVPKP